MNSDNEIVKDAIGIAPLIAERAGDAENARRFPSENLADLHSAGLMALAIPTELGGRGATTVAIVRVCEILAVAHASLAVAFVMHTACCREVSCAAIPETRDAMLGEAIHCGALICIGGAEGRDPSGAVQPLTARPTPGGWLLSGRKGYASGSDAATFIVASARDLDNSVTTFLLPMKTPGMSIVDPWDGLGMAASASNGVLFEDVFAPQSSRLAAQTPGFFRDTSLLFGLGLAATAVGLCEASLRFTLKWHAGAILPESVRNHIGEMSVRTEAARSLLMKAANEADRAPQSAEPWTDRAKAFAAETAHVVTILALRICGGHASRTRFPLERYVRDATALLIQGQRPDQLRIAVADSLLAN